MHLIPKLIFFFLHAIAFFLSKWWCEFCRVLFFLLFFTWSMIEHRCLQRNWEWMKENKRGPFSCWWLSSCSLLLRATTHLVCSLLLSPSYRLSLFLFLSYASPSFFSSSSFYLLPVEVSGSRAGRNAVKICVEFLRGGVTTDSVLRAKISL